MTTTTKDTSPIVFKCEASFWEMMADGGVDLEPDDWGYDMNRSIKPWDMRRFDLGDKRIFRLACGHWAGDGPYGQRGPDAQVSGPWPPELIRVTDRRKWGWVPDEPMVSFENKETGAVICFEYHGMEFVDWAPGWCWLILGKEIRNGQN